MGLTLLTTPKLPEYELIDSGEGEKLERFVDVIVRRPDPQALWKKNLPEAEWAKADAQFKSEGAKGRWMFTKDIPKEWEIKFDQIKFLLHFPNTESSFKHLGVFPEQYSNWKWIQETIKNNKTKFETPSILNLFAYTGGATMSALLSGAKVTHVDASAGAVEWAKENALRTGVKDLPVRWIVDDARKFVEREINRGVKYHGVILDPPSYGRGPKNQIWDIEKDFLPLFESVKKVLHNEPLFLLLNGYSAGYSALAYGENPSFLKEKFNGELEYGELSIADRNKRHLPCGIFARWRR